MGDHSETGGEGRLIQKELKGLGVTAVAKLSFPTSACLHGKVSHH